ncbi:GNAT family N-acetyltransferase [Domibacillus epiphyticus]|uniref:GNAT family N-acetyltransferase n=1 Tax=Domibacillus epiphyticus TaxID=1714355 RepID=A0A1V2A825_9BACI|nr:GNAT family N-acetyltransferase [Domibacillus epiphyticus]OMP67097.1 GNAT family N-acetyltransferase [Domibacillus epiphyticus]
MNWYEKLNQYFPIEEMKSKEQIEVLLRERGNVYHKDEGRNHVLIYVEFDGFVFVDYLFVSSSARGQGLGKKLINKLKSKNKPVILEVEPVQYEDSDTEKRLRFYAREGFQHASKIGYRRRSLATGEETVLEILYWSPEAADEKTIYEAMVKTYRNIHTYKDVEMYGAPFESVDQTLSFEIERTEDILKPFSNEVKKF